MNKITIEVFHNMRPRFESVLESSDVFRKVGSIDILDRSFKSNVEHMDELFAMTQNVLGGWPSNKTVQTELSNCRSTSVGDVMLVDETFYVVSDFGFEELRVLPKILKTFYDCPSFPSLENENIRIPVFDSLMESMSDIRGKMIKTQEAYVYRKGKLVDRVEYDLMTMESKIAGRLVTLQQTLGLLKITKEFGVLAKAVELIKSDNELNHLAIKANLAFYKFENADSQYNLDAGRSDEYENARCEYSQNMLKQFSNAVGMDEETMKYTSIPYHVISDDFYSVCEILNMHHLTSGTYLQYSQV